MADTNPIRNSLFHNSKDADGISASGHSSESHENSSVPGKNQLWPRTTMKCKEDEIDEKGKVKTKLLCLWNNVRYSWNFKSKTQFSKDSPIWLLGRIYDQFLRPTEPSGLSSNDFEALFMDFHSRIFLTYRKELPVFDGSYYTTDCGWGCMLRSGQMLLAQALVCHFLGRDWRWEKLQDEESLQKEKLHRVIVQWFGDSPCPASPLSIHQMVSHGHISGKKAGDWYGPASVSYILKYVLEHAANSHPELGSLGVYVAQDCAIYLDDIQQYWVRDSHAKRGYAVMGEKEKSLILLIPLRLGGEQFNPIYEVCLKGLLSLEQCIGIIGGKPKHSLYFIGWQDDYLIYMDPHQCQESVDVLALNFPLDSFHCKDLRKLHINRLDPSCCVGFYLRRRKDFEDFRNCVQDYLIPPQGDYPMFVFSHGNSPHVSELWLSNTVPLGSVSDAPYQVDEDSSIEGFEII